MLVTISDRKIQHDNNGVLDYYLADIVTANDYYPFGMGMPGRKYTAGNSYRFGFNGKENDNNIKGVGNQQDYGMRVCDPRVGRFLSVDPLTKDYPWNSTYAFAENRVIDGIDLEGRERYYTADGKLLGKYGTSNEMRIVKQDYVDALNKNNVNISAMISKPPNSNTINDLNSQSQTTYLNTTANQNKVLSKWAIQNRTREREKVMSLFTTIIDNPDGKGRISIFVEGSTGEGEKYVLGQGASVNPALSKSPFKNWKRSTTIHTHPYGGPLDFSNELEGFASGGDLQWAVRTEVDVYLVPPSGNVMGKFSICTYMDILRSYLLSHDSKDGYFKKMPYSEMFKAGGPGDPYYSKREARAAMQTVVINPE